MTVWVCRAASHTAWTRHSAAFGAHQLTMFLRRGILRLELINHAAAVAIALRCVAAPVGHAVDPPEEAKNKTALGVIPACASRKDKGLAFGPLALAVGREFEDHTVVMATAAQGLAVEVPG